MVCLTVAFPFRYKVELDSIAGSAGAAGRSRAAARHHSLAVTGAWSWGGDGGTRG